MIFSLIELSALHSYWNITTCGSISKFVFCLGYQYWLMLIWLIGWYCNILNMIRHINKWWPVSTFSNQNKRNNFNILIVNFKPLCNWEQNGIFGIFSCTCLYLCDLCHTTCHNVYTIYCTLYSCGNLLLHMYSRVSWMEEAWTEFTDLSLTRFLLSHFSLNHMATRLVLLTW